MTAKVLLVEDDAALARGLAFNLEADGHQVEHAADCASARASLASFDPALVVLDLNLPDGDGLDLLRELRAAGDQRAVLCLSARGQEMDQVMGLGLGADDYVTKPFALALLRARIDALLRRAGGGASLEVLSYGEVRLDLAGRRVHHTDREEELTPLEAEVLAYLAARVGQVVERAALLKDIWGVRQAGTTRTLDNHMARLRKKIELDPSDPRIVVTVTGAGYRMAAPGA
ncbi:MAG: response regulator transcription factor [Planctomycetota bacterium]|nr:response regulator transcription factor [Planctomycetota bacterium]